MNRLLLVPLFALPVFAAAQVTPFEIGIGYGQSDRFDKDSGGRGRLIGPELSISQSVFSLPATGSIRVGASAFFGGGLEHGSDTDGDVYRLFVHYKSPTLGAAGVYIVVGGHWATAKGRGGSFDKATRAGADSGVGMNLGAGGTPLPKTALEVISYRSKRDQLQGWVVSLKLRL